MTKNEIVITNITFSLARKIGDPEDTQNSCDLRPFSRTTLGFLKMEKSRSIWKPGLVHETMEKWCLKSQSEPNTEK